MAVPFPSREPAPVAPGSLMPEFQEPAAPAPISREPASSSPPSPAAEANSGKALPAAVLSGAALPDAALPDAALPDEAPAGEGRPGGDTVPLVIIDGANVVGSVPDGWWRDRAGAAVRLRDRLAAVPATGLGDIPAPVEVVLVVEGKARDIPQAPGGVRIERAAGSGDDKIIDLVRDRPATRRTIVVTADRGLRDRAVALNAEVRGPSTLSASRSPNAAAGRGSTRRAPRGPAAT